MKTLKSLFAIASTIATMTLTSCDDEPLSEIAAPAYKVFDIELFKENVDAYLDGNNTGFCYVIAKDGQAVYQVEDGERLSGADGSVAQDIHEPMYAASVSKMITAASALKLMEEKDISIDDKVWEFLPSHWTFHNSFKQVSFKNLLQHKSGIAGSTGYSYSSLKALAAAGVDESAIDVDAEYANANFGLFRILIPYMSNDLDLLFTSPDVDKDDVLTTITANIYRQYVMLNLFAPINITNVDTKPVGANPTLYYSFPTGKGQNGWTMGDRTLLAGGGGWYISCYDLAKLIAYMRFTEDVISDEVRDLMDENFMGWDKGLSDSANNDHGIYHAKNGGFDNASNQGVSTLVKNFPEGIQISIMINSQGGAYGGVSSNTGIANAYDNAWVFPND